MGLEPFASWPRNEPYIPRATRLIAPGELPGIETSVWMGGAHSHTGDPIEPERLQRAAIVDCAGDMPGYYRDRTGLWVQCVFVDVEGHPVQFDRLVQTVRRLADALRGGNGGAPESVYSICTHGMNRSGLIAGMLLRELGMPGPQTVELIREKRPGSLSNVSFRRILLNPTTW